MARNVVAHASCRGTLKSEPGRIIFASYEAVKLGELAIDSIPVEVMDRSTRWAHLLAERVEKLMRQLRGESGPAGKIVSVRLSYGETGNSDEPS